MAVFDNSKTLHKPTFIPFMRVTVLGMTGCGKTAFVNAFVNCACPSRYVSTDNQVLYYKKMEVKDEGEFDEIQRPIFIEVEDTPGSEKGPPGAVDTDDSNDAAGVPRIKKGSRVQLKGKSHVNAAFNSERWRLKLDGGYRQAMDGMCGKEFTVKVMARDGSIGLPSPDGSEGGVWNFPPECVTLKVTPEVPLDGFLRMDSKTTKLPKDPNKRKAMCKNFERPMAAFARPIGPPDQDKALTRNRMGFFICFDMTEDDHKSLKEAFNIYTQLMKMLKMKAKTSVGSPVIMFVGTKSDKSSSYKAIDINRESAQHFCDEQDVPVQLIETSAKTNYQVEFAFQCMVDKIGSREFLWSMDGGDDGGGGDGENGEGGCSIS